MIDLSAIWRPTLRQLRVFGLAGTVVFGGLGALVFSSGKLLGIALAPAAARTAAMALCALALFCLAGAALLPRALRPLYIVLSAITFPIGLVLSWVLLGAIYFLVFTPIALVFRLIGRDALHRRLDREAKTYWVERRRDGDPRRAFRQF